MQSGSNDAPMKNLAQRFLSAEEQARIMAAVKAAEQQTTGEIVPMVMSASYHYPVADLLGAAALALPAAVGLTSVVGKWLWAGPQNMWIFMGLFALCFACGRILVQRCLPLKRLFISQRELEDEVREAATTSFFEHGLHRTRAETGVLIFISLFEHKVWVLADRGINIKVPQKQWAEIVNIIVQGIRRKRQADAICEAIGRAGVLLQTHFPITPGDADELPDLIVAE